MSYKSKMNDIDAPRIRWIGAKCLECDEESLYWFRAFDPQRVRDFLSLGVDAVIFKRDLDRVNSHGLIEFDIRIIGGGESGAPGKFLLNHHGHEVVICDEYGKTYPRFPEDQEHNDNPVTGTPA